MSASATQETTQLLPLMLERLDVERRFSVFDAGPATPQTVDFFAKFKCRLHFADLYDEAVVAQQNDLSSEELTIRFTELLSFADGPFDLCLLWDVPNYLNPTALRAFGDALRPFIHRQTIAHGFCAFKETQPFTPQRYSIRAMDSLGVAPRTHAEAPNYPVTQNALVAALSFLTVVRGTLLTDGRVELFMEVI